MKSKALIICSILILFITGCSKSSDATNTFNATVNGTQLELALSEARISHLSTGNGNDSIVAIVITGAKSDYSKAFIFNLTMNNIDTGKFYFNEPSTKILSLQAVYKADTMSFSTQNYISTSNRGFILISSISSSTISGSFAFNATNPAVPNTSIEVKNGSFTAKIK